MIRLKSLLVEDYDPAQDKELWEMSESEFKDLIKSYESLRLTAYKLGDGKITIGWGHAEDISSSKYKVGQTITKQEAINLFNTDYTKEKNAIASNIPNWSKLPTYIKFALINAKFRGEFKTGYKWSQGIINDDWSDVAKNYSEGWGWPIPGGDHGTVAHRMTKNYNAFKKYANSSTPDVKPVITVGKTSSGTGYITIPVSVNVPVDKIEVKIHKVVNGTISHSTDRIDVWDSSEFERLSQDTQRTLELRINYKPADKMQLTSGTYRLFIYVDSKYIDSKTLVIN